MNCVVKRFMCIDKVLVGIATTTFVCQLFTVEACRLYHGICKLYSYTWWRDIMQYLQPFDNCSTFVYD